MKAYFKKARIVIALVSVLLLWFSDQSGEWELHMSIAGIVLLMIGLYLMQPEHHPDQYKNNEKNIPKG